MGDPVKYGAVWNGINPLTGRVYMWGDDVYYDSPVASPPNNNQSMLFHISLGFAKMPDNDLDEFASHVATELTSHAAIFTAPPVTPTNLTTAQGNFHAAIAAASEGGKSLTADKTAKREIVTGLLRQLAVYIEAIPNMTAANAMLSGFEVLVPAHHSPTALAVPVILGFNNVASTKLGVKLQGSPGARGYEFRVGIGSGVPLSGEFFSSTRGIVLKGLTPGTLYTVQVRALGGGNLTSEWSPSVNCMCT
jgi:hypothetical protein